VGVDLLITGAALVTLSTTIRRLKAAMKSAGADSRS
jgi:hypothetical protein